MLKLFESYGIYSRNSAGKKLQHLKLLNLVHPHASSVRILGMDYMDNEDK